MALADALKSCPNNNHNTRDDANTYCAVAEHCTKIQVFEIDRNHISESGASALSTHLKKCSDLTDSWSWTKPYRSKWCKVSFRCS